MSWLVDLAGKAEDLLNLVDQGAATALNKTKEDEVVLRVPADYYDQKSYTKSSFISSAADNIKNASRAETTQSGSSHRGSGPFLRRKKSEPDDEQLFHFLNSSDKVHNGPLEPQRDPNREARGAPTNSAKTTQDGAPNPGGTGPSMRPHHTDLQPLENVEDKVQDSKASDTSSTSSQNNGEQTSQQLSNLRLENQLLRSEVQSLNHEMALLLQRSKETQEELNDARTRIEKWNGDNSRSDRTLRELGAQMDDLTEAAAAKDSQLAVLKVRLQEADQLLSSRTEALEILQSERSRILQDHTDGSSLHNQALQSVQERLREAEAALKREQDGYKHMQNEFSARLSKMEAERQNLVDSLVVAEKKNMEERRRCDDLQQQLKFAKSAAESVKQEMTDYKHKATRILQSKEKLISSLKEGSGLEGLDSQVSSSMELEEMRHERDMQREDIQKLLTQIQQQKAELQDLETQQVSEAETSREQMNDLQEQMAEQRRGKQELEAELERQKQELQYTQEDFHRTKNTLQGRIREREEEIQKLRNQLTNKALSSSQTELESRLHHLTETLIQKQTMLESLSTEKNSLVYQLERMEGQLKSVQGSGSSINMAAMDSGDGARLRNVPVLFNDTNVAGMYGRVRKAASTIDQFSIRLGIFLRRYPIARVFIIIYMALLHLWVMIVLLTYTPEMHHGHPSGT